MPLSELFDLRDRRAIVTGGTRGIGRAIAAGLAAAGAKVAITGRTQHACDEAAKAINHDGGIAVGIAAHAGDQGAVAHAVDVAADTFGGLDIVINNAGISIGMRVGHITPEALQKSLDVNLFGPLFLVQHALPLLEASPAPSVINITTTGTIRPYTELSVYLTSKAALVMLTKTMALELGPKGIRVNAISPGMTNTDMVRNMDTTRQREVVASTPLGRFADPDELVGVAVFLASRASSFVTGEVIVVDGGLTIGAGVVTADDMMIPT